MENLPFYLSLLRLHSGCCTTASLPSCPGGDAVDRLVTEELGQLSDHYFQCELSQQTYCDHVLPPKIQLCVSAALSDGVFVDAIFLPVAPPSSLHHSNTWISILSHGAFSSHTPPPSPGLSHTQKHTHVLYTVGLNTRFRLSLSADLIAMASQLANQRLICVLEVCHLGGATTEIILTRGFLLEG